MTTSTTPAMSTLEPGQALPSLSIPITLQRLVMEAGANRDFSLIHHDAGVARATGAPDAFANTYFLMGMFERLMRECAGTEARIRKTGPLRMLIFNAVGDTVTFRGVVESVDPVSGEATLDMWAESDRGRTVTCKAVVVIGGT